ncbi:MAG: DUF3592 domain-containing protein, partial [Ornithinimicrobium sp.]
YKGFQMRRSSEQFVAAAATTNALVLDLRYHRKSSRNSIGGTYHPLLRFELPDGRIVEAETGAGSSPAPAKQGEVVPVRYAPQDPTNVELANSFVSGGSLGVCIMCFGLLFLMVGVLTSGVASLVLIGNVVP